MCIKAMDTNYESINGDYRCKACGCEPLCPHCKHCVSRCVCVLLLRAYVRGVVMEENEKGTKEERVRQTKKQLFWEIFRFLIVGGTATIVDYAISYLFYTWLLPPSLLGEAWSLIVSTAVGFSNGLVVNWFLSIAFVFKAVKDKKESRSGKAFLKFTLIGIIGLVISIFGMQLVRVLPSFELFGSSVFLHEEWTWWIMKAVMTLSVLVWNYVGRKIFVFKS